MGGPQRRVFLPNFWLKLVSPQHEQPPNVVQFACSMEMTIYDIKNYLEKIYNVDVVQVSTRIALGKTRQDSVKGYVVKDDDIKYAYVTLVKLYFCFFFCSNIDRRFALQPKDQKFEFPNLYPEKIEAERKDEEQRSITAAKKQHLEFTEKMKHKQGLPGWFLK